MDKHFNTIRIVSGCAAVAAAIIGIGVQLALAGHYTAEADALMPAECAAAPLAAACTTSRTPG